MATTSFTALRRLAGIVFALILFSLCLAGAAMGQSPLVTASSPTGLTHPTGWHTIIQTALDTNGDWLVEEYVDGGLFEFPANGGPMITLIPLDGMGGPAAYQNPMVLLDPNNNLYIGGNWNNCMLEFPYNAATNSWPTVSQITTSNTSPDACNGNTAPSFAQYSIFGFAPYYFQPWGVALGNSNTGTASGNIIVGNQNSGNWIFGMEVQGAWSNPNVPQSSSSTFEILSGLTKRPISIAVDPEGNIYFVEDSGGLSGVYQIPQSLVAAGEAAGTAGISTTDTSPGITRVDPNLPDVTGVVTDAAGNLYISDGDDGVFLVPNPSGTPQTSAAVLLSPLPTQGEVAVDPARKILWVPTTQNQTNGQADVAKLGIGHAEFGSAVIGATTSTAMPIDFSFNGAETPDRVLVMENGQAASDFTVSGGSCAMQTAYAVGSFCSVNLTMTPHAVGSVSGELLMQRSDPVAKGAANYSDAITNWTPAGSTIVLTANNTLIAGEEIVINASATDSLAALNGQEFNVLAAGLSKTQFAITASVTPPASGSAPFPTSATLTAKAYTTIATMRLHGTGMGANAQAFAGLESAIGSTLKTPTQVALDGLGNVYVADPGLAEVLMYPAGSGTPIAVGSGLTSPTGVAVDGAGDVFIADSGAGSVYEIPVALPGLESDGGQVTLASGFGTSGLNLAADGLGDLYVADPTNHQVVKLSGIGDSSAGALAQSETMLTAGFTQPSAVGVDSNNNLYVVDGANLFELAGGVATPISASTPTSVPATVLNSLSGATGVAADPSGAVYISSASGTVRIPYTGGALVSADETAIAPDVTDSSSVALDRLGNVYVTPAAGPGVKLVSTVGTLTLPTPPSLTSPTSATTTITNAGNTPLLITGYTNSSSVVDSVTIADFSGADGTCVGDSTAPATGIAPGATCQVVVTFNPGPGEQGALTGWIEATSNAINGPVTIDTAGTGLALGPSKTAVSVGSTAQVVSTPVTVTVTPSSGAGTPTGTVQVTYTSWTVVVPNCASPPCAPTITPETVTAASALTNGQAQFTLAPVLAGSQTFTVGYAGDRVYGRSIGNQAGSVAKSSIAGFLADSAPPPYLPFVQQQSGSTPYDGSQQYWQYNMPVTVNTAAGIPTGTLTFMDNSSACPAGTSATGQGAAMCALSNTSSQACPQTGTTPGASSGSQFVTNIGTPSANTGATATFVTSCLQMPTFVTYTPVISTHYITPVYSGDANFLGATDGVSSLFQVIRSSLVNITTSTPAAPSKPIPTATISVQPGSTASTTLYLAPLLGYGFEGKGAQLNNYNFPVTLSCDNLPPHTECTFIYPTSVSAYQPTAVNSAQICPQPTLDSNSGTSAAFEALAESGGCNASGVGVVTMTINTDVSVGTTTTSQNAAAASVTLASLFGLGMVGLFFRRRAFQKGRWLLMAILIVVGGSLAVTLTACNTTNLAPLAQLSTPAGTYPVSITAVQVGTQCVPQAGPGSNCTTPSGGTGVLVYGSNNQVSLPYFINVTVQ